MLVGPDAVAETADTCSLTHWLEGILSNQGAETIRGVIDSITMQVPADNRLGEQSPCQRGAKFDRLDNLLRYLISTSEDGFKKFEQGLDLRIDLRIDSGNKDKLWAGLKELRDKGGCCIIRTQWLRYGKPWAITTVSLVLFFIAGLVRNVVQAAAVDLWFPPCVVPRLGYESYDLAKCRERLKPGRTCDVHCDGQLGFLAEVGLPTTSTLQCPEANTNRSAELVVEKGGTLHGCRSSELTG